MNPFGAHPFLVAALKHEQAQSGVEPPKTEAEWTSLIEAATEQGLLPFIARWLRNHANGNLALHGQLLETVRARSMGIAARNLILKEELLAILGAFSASRIPCIPIRGLALAEWLYGDFTSRPIGDLDLLIQREKLSDVGLILERLGYREIDHGPHFAIRHKYSAEYTKDRLGLVLVEPHWTLTYPPFTDRIDMEQVWRRSVPGRILGRESLLLSTEDLLLHLCCHLMHWGDRAPLLWLYEIDRIIRLAGMNFDWPYFVETAMQSGQAEMVRGALKEAHRVFRTPLSDRVWPLPRDPSFWPSEESPPSLLQRRLIATLAGGSKVRGREEFATFLSLPGIRMKVRYALTLLFPSPAFMRFRYGPAGRGGLAFRYVARTFQLSWEGIKWMKDLLLTRSAHS